MKGIGLLLGSLVLLTSTAPASAQQSVRPEIQALTERYNAMRPETKLALMNARQMARNGDLDAAAQLLKQTLQDVTPDSDDFYELQLLLITVWTRQGNYEQCADTFATWIRTSQRVDVVDPFIDWLCFEAKTGHDRLERLIKEYQEPVGAARQRMLARLLVGDLEQRVYRDAEGDVEPLLRRAVGVIRASKADYSMNRLLRFGAWLTQSNEQPHREIKFRRLIFEVVGEDSLDVPFLMSMAGGEYVRGDRVWTRRVLKAVRPLIADDDANTLASWLMLSARQHMFDAEVAEAKAEVEALRAIAPQATRLKYVGEQLKMIEDELSKMGPGSTPSTLYRPGAIQPIDPPLTTTAQATTGPAPADDVKPTAPDPRQAEEALRTLAADAPDAQSIERAARLATMDFGRRDLNEDFIARLLIAYREILNRPGKETLKDTVRAIDEKLLWLARDTDRLANVRHWSLWADAVAALRGVRASRDLKRFVYQDAATKLTEPAVRKEVERARAALEDTKEPESLPEPSTQPATTTRPS